MTNTLKVGIGVIILTVVIGILSIPGVVTRRWEPIKSGTTEVEGYTITYVIYKDRLTGKRVICGSDGEHVVCMDEAGKLHAQPNL